MAKLAPREVFEQILEWAVIPTFDIVFEYGDQGVIFVKRKIEPYKGIWALPGLRMHKGESIDQSLIRIAQEEIGVRIDSANKQFLGQYTAKFKTENQRQDLSTGFLIRLKGNEKLDFNKDHFSELKISKVLLEPTGKMYSYFFEQYKKLT